MRAALRAGIGVYNAGEYHAAHDAWEDHWLDLEAGSPDERLLHGLIQFTAAVHHAQSGNWKGLRGLAESGAGYLDEIDADHRDVNVGAVRAYLARLAADPEHVERASPPALTHEGDVVALSDLRFEAGAIAAGVLAEEYDPYDEDVIDAAAGFGRADLEDGSSTSPFVTLVLDFAADAERRDLVYQRLSEHVERRAARDADVEGLFDA